MKRRFFLKLVGLLPFVGLKTWAKPLVDKGKDTVYYLYQPLHSLSMVNYGVIHYSGGGTVIAPRTERFYQLTGWEISQYNTQTGKKKKIVKEVLGRGDKIYLGFILARRASFDELWAEWSHGYEPTRIHQNYKRV